MAEETIVKKTTDELAEDRTQLAYDRTALANDRTLMAWIRTSTTLISFGFTIYKFFQDFRKAEGFEAHQTILGARDLGIILISFGFIGLLFGLIQYRSDMKRIHANYEKLGVNIAPIMAILMLILSLLLLLAAVFRQ